MIIVNQDKTVILNFDSLYCIMLDNNQTNKIIYAVSNGEGDILKLGEYTSEERAKEVLQEIVRYYAIANIGQVFEIPEE